MAKAPSKSTAANARAAKTLPQDPGSPVKTGAQVARQAAATAQAKGVSVEASRAFTLNRDDGTTREFLPGLNKGVSKEDADHWYVKAHTVGEAKSGVADVRPIMDPNGVAGTAGAADHDADLESTTQALDMGKGEGGTGEDTANAYGEDEALADMARAEAGDADAKARVEAYEAALNSGGANK